MRNIAIVICLLILVAGGAYYLSQNQKQANPQVLFNSNLVPSNPSPTPMPFQELTIPYLRTREYKSTISNLNMLTENSNYTSYLTSYTSDGLKINGLLTKPTGQVPSGGWPAVIFIHGYIPPAQYKTTQNYADYVDYLAKNGFVVFKIDLRGHAQSEGEPGGAYYSSDYVIDALNAYAALQSTDFINSQKIGLWGHSMAGNVVFRALAANPKIPAIVIWSGAVYTYTDFSEYQISDNSYQPLPPTSEVVSKRQELFETHGGFDPDSPFWKQVPGTNYLKEVEGSVQVHHAVNDNVVSIDYSRNLKGILESNGISFQLHEYQTGGHNLNGPSFIPAMQRTVEFYKANL